MSRRKNPLSLSRTDLARRILKELQAEERIIAYEFALRGVRAATSGRYATSQKSIATDTFGVINDSVDWLRFLEASQEAARQAQKGRVRVKSAGSGDTAIPESRRRKKR